MKICRNDFFVIPLQCKREGDLLNKAKGPIAQLV